MLRPSEFSQEFRSTGNGQLELDDTVSISSETYARLLSLADQAPLECLPLTERTLERAKTLGYNQIGQIRMTPASRLVGDLGEERAEELHRALDDFGMRQTSTAD